MPASAAVSWQFATGSNLIVPSSFCGGAQSFTYGNCDTWHATPSAGNPDVDVRAYANTGTGSTIATAYLDVFSGGLGVTNTVENTGPSQTGTSGLYPANQFHPTVAAPNHAIDNSGNTDSVLLSFQSKVSLTGVLIGWPTATNQCGAIVCDTDISVWAYTGAGTPNLLSPGQTYGSLAAGWVMVGNYADVPVGTQTLINSAPNLDTAGTNTSQYWLISAYYGTSLSTGNDFVKLQAVYGVVPRVSEPESMVLLLISLLGGAWMRRAKAS